MRDKDQSRDADRDFLINKEEQFDQLISHFFDIIVLIDEKGHQHYVSSSCEKILGYRPEELLGVSVIEKFLHPEDQNQARKGLWSIIKGGKNGGTQYRHRHKNGGWVYLEAFGTNQLENPAIRSVVLNVRDISERKKTEADLIESQRQLKELNATKDRFLSIIGHDLKNPVSNILGLTEIIQDQLKSQNYSEMETYTGMLHESAGKTFDLLSNLLTWARSQTGSIQYRPEDLDLEKLVGKVIDLMGHAAIGKSISLENRIPRGSRLHADPCMIELIIRNLVSNAIKFTHENGSVIIECEERGDVVTVYVKDTGIGIPEEEAANLFLSDPHSTRQGTHKETGTGLGLVLCKEFVERHGGRIHVQSRPDEGSCFHFDIPRDSQLST
jgi:PAS domain S-box-containing protein